LIPKLGGAEFLPDDGYAFVSFALIPKLGGAE